MKNNFSLNNNLSAKKLLLVYPRMIMITSSGADVSPSFRALIGTFKSQLAGEYAQCVNGLCESGEEGGRRA